MSEITIKKKEILKKKELQIHQSVHNIFKNINTKDTTKNTKNKRYRNKQNTREEHIRKTKEYKKTNIKKKEGELTQEL